MNSRVGQAAALPKAKGKTKEESLEGVPVDIQEAIILEDLLYILMVCALHTSVASHSYVDQGIEGNYITYHSEFSPEDDDLFQGIRFVPSASLGKAFGPLEELS